MTIGVTSKIPSFSLSNTLIFEDFTGEWIGKLVSLGRAISIWSRENVTRGLVVVITVPVRNYAAALISAGWVSASVPGRVAPVSEFLASSRTGQQFSAVIGKQIVSSTLRNYFPDDRIPRITTDELGSFAVDSIEGIADGVGLPHSKTTQLPEGFTDITAPVTSFENVFGMSTHYLDHLLAPEADLAIVGTLSKLIQDFQPYLKRVGDRRLGTQLFQIVRPFRNYRHSDNNHAAPFTNLFSTAEFESHIPVDFRCVILDGASPTMFLNEIDNRVVVCVLDRSVEYADAAEVVRQRRSASYRDVSLAKELSWFPSLEVEALAFEVSV